MVSTGHGTFCHGSRDFPPSFLQRVTVDSVCHSVASLQVTRLQVECSVLIKSPSGIVQYPGVSHWDVLRAGKLWKLY